MLSQAARGESGRGSLSSFRPDTDLKVAAAAAVALHLLWMRLRVPAALRRVCLLKYLTEGLKSRGERRPGRTRSPLTATHGREQSASPAHF